MKKNYLNFIKKSFVVFVAVALIIGSFSAPASKKVFAKAASVSISAPTPTPSPAPTPSPSPSPSGGSININTVNPIKINILPITMKTLHLLTQTLQTQLTISDPTLTLSKTYDGNTSVVVAAGTLSGVNGTDDVSVTAIANYDNENVGTGKTITVVYTLGGIDAGNYTAPADFTVSTGEITPATVNVTASSDTMIYGGIVPTITATYSPTIVPTTTAVCSTVATNLSPVGTYTSTCSGAADANYIFTYINGSVSVTPATPIISWVNPADITYGTLLSATQLDATASVPGTFVYTPALGIRLNAGVNQTLSVTFIPTDAINYTGSNATVSINVNVKPITVTVDAGQSKIYGQTDPIFTYTFSPALESGDSFTGVLVRDPGESVGAYTINQGSLNLSANYNLVFTPNTFTITAEPVVVTAISQSKIYGNTDPIFTYTSSDPTATFTGALDRTPGTAVGVYPIGIGTLVATNNYTISSFVPNNLTITPDTLTVSAVGLDKVYDGATTATVNLSDDRISGDVFTTNYTTSDFADKNVGNGKIITVTGINISGIDAANYTLGNTIASTTANITPASLTISAVGVNKVYDGIITATVNLTDNRIAGDVLTTGYTTSTFADKNVGVAKLITVTGITVTGTDAGNYTFNNATTAAADISVLPVVVTAITNTKVYDTTTNSSAIPAIVPALVGTDTSNFIETFNTAIVGTGKILTPSGTINDGNGGNNYAITFYPDNTGVIVQATPVITWPNPSFLYFGTYLTGIQLDATASVPGTFTYTPGLNTVLNPGLNQALSVSFVPNDSVNYTMATGTAYINIYNHPGSNGGGFVSTPTTTTTSVSVAPVNGQVLGAESFHFTLRLLRGSTGNEVLELQKFLNAHGFIVSATGNGSIGHESTYFGLKTELAVIKFQAANKLKADGIVGTGTRAILNK